MEIMNAVAAASVLVGAAILAKKVIGIWQASESHRKYVRSRQPQKQKVLEPIEPDPEMFQFMGYESWSSHLSMSAANKPAESSMEEFNRARMGEVPK